MSKCREPVVPQRTFPCISPLLLYSNLLLGKILLEMKPSELSKAKRAILLSSTIRNPPTTSVQKEKMLTANPSYQCKWYEIP